MNFEPATLNDVEGTAIASVTLSLVGSKSIRGTFKGDIEALKRAADNSGMIYRGPVEEDEKLYRVEVPVTVSFEEEEVDTATFLSLGEPTTMEPVS